jgi:hypothetical protein
MRSGAGGGGDGGQSHKTPSRFLVTTQQHCDWQARQSEVVNRRTELVAGFQEERNIIGMQDNRLARLVKQIIASESLDLYVLSLAALTLTAIGFSGDLSSGKLASAILAMLTLLALSQIRSRRHVSEIAASQAHNRFSIFKLNLPEGYQMPASARSFLFIGWSMVRSVQTMRTDMRRLLESRGKVQVLLLDPSNDELLRVAAGDRRDILLQKIEVTLRELDSLRQRVGGDLEVRVSSFIPKICIHAFDPGLPSSVIYVQHYEYKSPGEEAPIFRLELRDGFWHNHFVAEAQRMWEDGLRWPLTPSQALARSPRPSFTNNYGDGLRVNIAKARYLLVTGHSRNAMVRNHRKELRELLTSGCRIRFLLLDPSAEETISSLARFTATRSAAGLRNRIQDTIRLLDELRRSTGGSVTVRLSSNPITMGLIAIDGAQEVRSEASALFLEYLGYPIGGEPIFVLQPADQPWFDNFLAEAEAIWSESVEYVPPGTADASAIST